MGPGGSSVIAKRSRSSAGVIERTIYGEVLPHLPVTSPRFYGTRDEGENYCWLFLEDVGACRYAVSNREHSALAGRWLGRMHTSATRVADQARLSEVLPDGGPGGYLEHLRTGRRTILRNISNPGLGADDVELLDAVVSLQDRLEAEWNRVEQACAGMPHTLVHGDFRPKNAYLRQDSSGLQLFPIDWAMAGWGVPAADLTRVDLEAYASAIREDWPGLDSQTLRRHARLGQVFGLLAAIAWESLTLRFEARQILLKPITTLRVYRDELSTAVQAPELA